MDAETRQYIDDAEARGKVYALDVASKVAAEYKQKDTWWQAYRREHPLAVQNILGFGGLLVGVAIGIPTGMWLK